MILISHRGNVDMVNLEREKVVEDIIQVYRQDMIQQEGKDPAKGEDEIAEKVKDKNKATLSKQFTCSK